MKDNTHNVNILQKIYFIFARMFQIDMPQFIELMTSEKKNINKKRNVSMFNMTYVIRHPFLNKFAPHAFLYKAVDL